MITIYTTKETIKIYEALSSATMDNMPSHGVIFSEKSQNEIKENIEKALLPLKFDQKQ
jgi:hypothetical protein